MTDEEADRLLKLVTIISLASLLLVSLIGIILVALFTDRDVARAEGLTFGGVFLLSMLGGLTWVRRRRHWKVNLERHEGQE